VSELLLYWQCSLAAEVVRWPNPRCGTVRRKRNSNFESCVHAFTAPLARPDIKYFLRIRRKTRSGVRPRIEAADTNPQSTAPLALTALKMKRALVNV
jgi:hypothetical protein